MRIYQESMSCGGYTVGTIITFSYFMNCYGRVNV